MATTMITEWETVSEPQVQSSFSFPFYATDIQILSSNRGVVMVPPNGINLYRLYVDLDGAISTEFVNLFGGFIPGSFPPAVPPFPVFGECLSDLLILSPGKGILFPAGLVSSSPRLFYRLRLDNDGSLGSELVSVDYWMKIPENNIPERVTVDNDWLFTNDIQFVTPGQGIVMKVRGGSSVRRVRIDSDGAILSEAA